MSSRMLSITFAIAFICTTPVLAAAPHTVTIDGSFADWAALPSYTDPADNMHDTDHTLPDDVPVYVEHPDVDLLEFKLTHDDENLYAYFRSAGVIGNTQTEAEGKAGRYYVILTIDVDQDDATGYWLNEGGYFPTSPGYDMNAEVEFYDGAFNTGHYLNHGCLDEAEFLAAQEDQALEIVDVRAGTYDWYTQWVMFDTPRGLPEEILLPSGRSLVWVADRGPVYQGIVEIQRSADGHEAEMKAPYRGFMRYPGGAPILAPGRTIDVSFSLEASGELAPGQAWASNTALPINGYRLTGTHHRADSDRDGRFSLSEISRLIQFYNTLSYHCADGTEDGYAPGPGDENCVGNDGDYTPADWKVNLSELLRAVQLYHARGYHACDDGEDGYCPVF